MGTVETLLAAPAGFRSREVARFLWQMDEQRRALLDDTRDLDVETLAWQPAPGTNTIGMLLAHIAYAETHLVQVGIEGRATSDTRAVIGIGVEEEGMPLAPDAPPSPALAGRALADFHDMLARARAATRNAAATLTDADLERQVVRQRPDGSRRVFNVGWVLYHLIEHEAGHRGQINLLRHLRRARIGGSSGSP
jgi:uncharacterized damage-inducible protein DinB